MASNMNRRRFLKTAGGALAAAAPVGSSLGAASAQRKPNIVMIYADDLDFDEITPYDHARFPSYTGAQQLGILPKGRGKPYFADPRMLTPNIDRLAAEGVTFERFYITTSICTPSRYSVLTGRFASRSPDFLERFPTGRPGNIQWNTPLDAEETNVAKALKACGYATGMVGKWHLGGPSGKTAGIAEDADPRDPEVTRKLREAHERAIEHIRATARFDFVDRIYPANKEEIGLPKSMQVHNLEWITEGALNFIDQNRDRPFFLYMPLTTPHAQYQAGWWDGDPRATPAGMLERAPEGMPSRPSVLERIDKAGIDRRNAMGTWIDDAVGAVMRRLESLGIADDTVFIFASDHQSRGKFTCYEGCRVPFIVRWPKGAKAGGRVDWLCANVDLAATFVELAGGAPPPDMTRDGRSFASLLRGERPREWRESLLLECSNIRAVVTPRWKYIASRVPENIVKRMEEEAREAAAAGKRRRIGWDGRPNPHPNEQGVWFAADLDFPHYFDKDQLYDLESDVYEQKNLAADSAHADTLAALKKRLRERLTDLPHSFGEFTK